ncbi:hypothetical protein pqer_cds_1054 [Pandoravirus quercus]|uniref:Uncharacterized protein n=1 Tax=Pandoravirus quercus TaxID=2107709 RepID=A0A2U7UAM8_9VIRU|nr:hypothetical protein pqer_cds_1054 [Pandoravirus quercus]AVK75476.1 hypothetical protein pqer_cds_1054 [Pandoravirus quercus]
MATPATATTETTCNSTPLRPVPDGRLTDQQVEAMRAELWTQWSGHHDVWGISVQTDDEGRHFIIFDLGDDAQPFPASLPIAALGGFEVPLRTFVVGRIVAY